MSRTLQIRKLWATAIVFFALLGTSSMSAQAVSGFSPHHWTADNPGLPDAPQAPPVWNHAPPSSAVSGGCVDQSTSQFGDDLHHVGTGIKHLPSGMVQPHNLAWELPVAAASATFITYGDTRVADFKSGSLTDAEDKASSVGLGLEVAAAAATYIVGCSSDHAHARHAGQAALESMGYGLLGGEVLKIATNRERPDKLHGNGGFWDGGNSFPSGHAVASWAFASAIAHQYPNNRWVKWTAYGAATSVSLLRVASRRHFPSDIIIGGTVGYITGAYIGGK